MIEILQQFVPQLTHDEKVELYNELRVMIADDIAGAPVHGAQGCPRCGCDDTVRKGHGADGSQRWLCKGCGRTFGSSTRSVIGASKLPAATWYAFAECMADELSLRVTARRIGVSLPTAWFMRHRVCEMMASRLPAFRDDVPCEVDSTYLTESMSGNHALSQAHPMPRDPRRSGSELSVRGISNEKVCVLCGVNDLGDVFVDLCCRGRESAAEAKDVLSRYLGCDSVVATDGHGSYPKALRALGCTHKVVASGALPMVNGLHSRLKSFLSGFNGVSTRRLQHYLDWFCWKESFKGAGIDRRALLSRHQAEGRYLTTWREYALSPYPFISFWNDANPALT